MSATNVARLRARCRAYNQVARQSLLVPSLSGLVLVALRPNSARASPSPCATISPRPTTRRPTRRSATTTIALSGLTRAEFGVATG